MGAILHRLGLARLSARPRLPQCDADTQAVYKNTAELARAAVPHEARANPLEIRFQDEVRAGQQGTLTRMWARKGTRPRAPKHCRWAWAYIFGAVCPACRIGAALVIPYANTEAMNAHLPEITGQVSPRAHALPVLDGASWHSSTGLVIPPNISLLPLPPCSPDLDPVENLCQFLRQNVLANRVFDSYEAIVDVCCHARNTLLAMPERVASITSRDWAKAGVNAFDVTWEGALPPSRFARLPRDVCGPMQERRTPHPAKDEAPASDTVIGVPACTVVPTMPVEC